MTRTPLLPLALLVVVFAMLATAYNIAVPVFEGPDEPQHFFFAQHLAHALRLPVQTLNENERGPWEQEGSQPPLYYTMVAPLVRIARTDFSAEDLWYNHQNTMGTPALVGNENRYIHAPEIEGWPWHGYSLAVHLGRALSTLFGAIAVVCVASVASRVLLRQAAGDEPNTWLPIATAAVVAFNPQFLAVSSTFSNDALVVALTTAALALLLRVVDGHDDATTLLALAVVVGLTPLAKLSGIALVAFALVTLLYVSWRRSDRRPILVGGGLILVATATIGGWWIVRNQMLYGEPTGLSHMLSPSLQRVFIPDRWLRGLPAELLGMWYSSWALFGWFTVMAPKLLYVSTIVATIAAMAGLVIAALRRAVWFSWPRIAWLVLWSMVVLASLLRWMTMAKGAHGRLMFPAIATLAVVLVVGWRALVPRRFGDRALAVTIAAAMCAVSVYALVGVIRPAYAWPETIAESEIPESAARTDIVFDGKLRLLAAEVPARATEGDVVPITLYWQVLEPVTRDGFVALRVDQDLSDIPSFLREVGGWHIVSSEAELAHPGDGAAPWATFEPSDAVIVDRQHVVVPTLETAVYVEPGTGTPVAAPRMPVAARLSVHLYDTISHKVWSGTQGDPISDTAEWSTELLIDPTEAIRAETDPDTPSADGAHGSGWRSDRVPLSSGSLLAQFENGMELHGVGAGEIADPESDVRWWVRTASVAGGPQPAAKDAVRWTGLTWLPGRVIDVDLRAFVHLVDESGHIVAQFDGPLSTHGPYRTQLWRAREPIVAVTPWRVPAETPNGRYRLLLGLYDPSSGERVPAFYPGGGRFLDDAVAIEEIEVTD